MASLWQKQIEDILSEKWPEASTGLPQCKYCGLTCPHLTDPREEKCSKDCVLYAEIQYGNNTPSLEINFYKFETPGCPGIIPTPPGLSHIVCLACGASYTDMAKKPKGEGK